MALSIASIHSDAIRLISAKGMRAVGDGFVSILLPAYLLALGLGPFEVGMVTTATLLGSAVLTLLAGRIAGRFGHRRPLLAASGLMVLTGLGFAGFDTYLPLLAIAFVGTLNPSSGDVSVFLPLEQSLLSRSVGDADRTRIFAYYSLAGSLMGALGTLCAALPGPLSAWTGMSPLAGMRVLFLAYAAIGAGATLVYRGVQDTGVGHEPEPVGRLGPSRRNVYRLTALFSVDAFGGGFVVQSILALWLFRTFDLPIATAANIFFGTNLLAAVSFLVAVPIARRFGLVNTMVFTHLPSSLFLLLIPFIPKLAVVIGLLMLRSLLSQMDVPTRTSYVMAVVTPPERPAAASLTSVPRSLAAAVSPVFAGLLLTLSAFAWPLLLGGALKIAYDVTLLAMFRHVRPAEERKAASEAAPKTERARH
jgi:MFS family permease